jgi:hypothetical protein
VLRLIRASLHPAATMRRLAPRWKTFLQ